MDSLMENTSGSLILRMRTRYDETVESNHRHEIILCPHSCLLTVPNASHLPSVHLDLNEMRPFLKKPLL